MKIKHNERKHNVDAIHRKEDKLDFFPFVSGEMIEEHRRDLSKQLRSDLQMYMTGRTNKGKWEA